MHQQLRLQKHKQSGGLSVVADNLQLRPTPQRYCKAARAILVCCCTNSNGCIEMLRNLPPVKQTRKRRGGDYSARLGSGCLLRFRGDSSDASAPPLFARLRDVGDVCGAME